MVATEQGRLYASTQLLRRREENRDKKQINNSDLPLGSPMYYYCIGCGDIADVLPENWFMGSPRKLCEECQALKNLGWFE